MTKTIAITADSRNDEFRFEKFEIKLHKINNFQFIELHNFAVIIRKQK